jgi:hypothetical protein
MSNTTILIAAFTTTILFSCSKKEDEKKLIKPTEKASIIGKWKCLSAKGDKAIGYDPSGNPVYDFYEANLLPDCRKDDLTIFLESKDVALDEGATKCSATDKQTIRSGTWALNADTLEMLILGKTTKSKIIQLDSITLKIQYTGPYTRYYNNGSIDTIYAELTMTSTYQREK